MFAMVRSGTPKNFQTPPEQSSISRILPVRSYARLAISLLSTFSLCIVSRSNLRRDQSRQILLRGVSLFPGLDVAPFTGRQIQIEHTIDAQDIGFHLVSQRTDLRGKIHQAPSL